MICPGSFAGGMVLGVVLALLGAGWYWRDRPTDVLALLDEDGA